MCCYNTNATFPYFSATYNTLYNTCPAANSTEIFETQDLSAGLCIYCPSDHPTYDPLSTNCLTSANVTTNAVGTNCATLNTILPTSFTDVTFLDGSNNVITAYNVKVAYNCP